MAPAPSLAIASALAIAQMTALALASLGSGSSSGAYCDSAPISAMALTLGPSWVVILSPVTSSSSTLAPATAQATDFVQSPS